MSRDVISILSLLAAILTGCHGARTPDVIDTDDEDAPSATVTGTMADPRSPRRCLVRGALPDPQCTPGAVFDVTLEQICTPGYAKSVRKVTSQTKREVLSAYGITSSRPGDYEIDHLISLQLGGSNEPANLWPEAAEPRPGFHEKDQVENELHRRLCHGEASLAEVQRAIATDWRTALERSR